MLHLIYYLVGVNSQYSEGAPLMILEYMPYGDLQSFLKRHKSVYCTMEPRYSKPLNCSHLAITAESSGTD